MLTAGYLATVVLATLVQGSLSIQCYRCTSDSTSCPSNQGQVECSRTDDKCVRLEQNLIGEEKGKKLFTMDCLNKMARSHTDLPKNRSEGCRVGEPQEYTLIGPAAALTPTSDEVNTYCFCNTAEACNSAVSFRSGLTTVLLTVAIAAVVMARNLT